MWTLQCILNIYITIRKYKVIGFAACSLIHRMFDYIFWYRMYPLQWIIFQCLFGKPVYLQSVDVLLIIGMPSFYTYAAAKALAVCLVLIYSKSSLQNSQKNHKIIHKKHMFNKPYT
jgi:hypothetical protein